MAIDAYKVTTSEVDEKNVKSAPDVLTADARQNKNWFDRLVEYFITKYNGLIDYLANNLAGQEATGRGLVYKDDKIHWKYAVEKGGSFGFSFSGNIQPTLTGAYDTVLATNLNLSQGDMMDCFLIVNNVEYQCGDSWADGALYITKTKINNTEIRLTYSTLNHELTMFSSENPLETTYWNVEVYRGEAEKVLSKSLPGSIANDKYTELRDRIDGLTGEIGKTIYNTINEYGVSNSEATPPMSWQATPPPTTKGQWLWVKTTTVFNDLSENTVYTKSYIGTDGEDGISVAVQSASKTGGVTTVVLADSDGNLTTMRIEDGEDGDVGQPGDNGYVHIAWANSSDGSVDFSTSMSVGKLYMGVYSDNTETDSQDYHDYSWTKIKGETGTPGTPGADGNDGVGVDTVQPLYALSTSSSTAPADNAFSTTLNYASGYFIWTRDRVKLSDGTYKYSTKVYNQALTETCQLSSTTAQTFWVKGSNAEGTNSVPTGAYVTQISRDSYDDYKGGTPSGGSLLLRSAGAFIRTARRCVAAFMGSGIQLYDPSGTETYDSNIAQYRGDKVAEFTSGSAQIGKDNSTRFKMNAGSLQAYDSSNNKYFEVSASGLTFGTSAAASQSYADSKASTAQNNAISTAASDATSKANAAKSAAISTAASDATTKANAAETNAKTYAKGYVDDKMVVLSDGLYMYTGTQPTADAKGNSARVASDGFHVYSGGVERANFGSVTRIGEVANDQCALYITSDGLQIVRRYNGVDNEVLRLSYLDSGLVVDDHDQAIGRVLGPVNGSLSSVANSTQTNAPSSSRMTLSAGTYVVTAWASFASNSTGRRWLTIYDMANYRTGSEANQTAVSGAETKLTVTDIVEVESGSRTYTPRVYQNSGGSLGVDMGMNAIRIS